MKRALVTGGSGGIGAAICARLAAAGHHVIVHANRGMAKAEAVVADIVAQGGSAEAVAFDITDRAATAAALAADIGFTDLGLRRIEVRVLPGNAASLRVARKLGARPEGLARASVRHGDAWVDAELFALERG